MCGIFAVFYSDTPRGVKEIIQSSEYMRGRGPDDCSSLIEDNAIFVFYRLAIMDTSSSGNQPMQSGQITMMCNGEIYNYKHLIEKHELKCVSQSDCEVILRLYEKVGFVDMIKELDGVYAIVLKDGDKVYLARDRIGVRPLYFGLTEENYLAVSSLPNCLLPFCDGVSSLPPGVSVVHTISKQESSRINVFQYIHRDIVEETPSLAVETYPQVLREVLTEAVKKRLMSDRPIGCLLSGGLDSSLVTAILCKFLGGHKVRTYSIGMEGSTDLYYARKVSEYFGTQHTEVKFTYQEGLEAIPKVIECLGSYDITTVRASVGMYLISQYISKNTTDRVIFSGEGSDELFAGYLYFHNAPTEDELKYESRRLVRELSQYDVLRADRTLSINGLELREPFLDRSVVDLAWNMPSSVKKPQNKYEKYVLRKAFEGYLPDEVLWRQKCAFSDGVSAVKKSWFQYIQEFVDRQITDEAWKATQFPSKEALYYYMIFKQMFPGYELTIPYWMPRWSNATDPSARTLAVCTEKDE